MISEVLLHSPMMIRWESVIIIDDGVRFFLNWSDGNMRGPMIFHRVFMGIGLGLVVLTTIGRGEEFTFRAGASVVDVTPLKFPVSMTGSFTDRKATSAHDPLHIRCLVLDDGRIRVALVVCDSCLIPREVFDAAKKSASQKTKILTSRMLMSATHTHTAPTAYGMAQCKPDPEYLDFLTRQIAAAVEKANNNLEPARIGWGVAQVPDQVFNRRWKMNPAQIPPDPFGNTTDKVRTNPGRFNAHFLEPAGPTDPEVSFVSIQSPSGQPRALLASYSLHYVGGIKPGALSADYFGEFAQQLEDRVKSKSFVGILANGTSGDVNNINVRDPAVALMPFEKIREVAGILSEAVSKAAQEAPHHAWVPLAMVEREISLGVRRPDANQLTRARDLIAASTQETIATVPLVYAQEAVALSQFPEKVRVKLQALRIGQLGIVAEPCEAFAEIGLEIKRKSPFKPTFVIGLANGYRGYLPTAEQHELGGYETWPSRWSYLEQDASDKIVESLLEMLAEISPATSPRN